MLSRRAFVVGAAATAGAAAVGGCGGGDGVVACGTGDPFYASTRHLVSLMNFPHQEFFGPGFHDASYWASVAPSQLRAMAPALGLTAL